MIVRLYKIGELYYAWNETIDKLIFDCVMSNMKRRVITKT